MIEKNVKTKLDFDGREMYWSAKNNWKVKRFLCICLVEIKLLKEKVLLTQVAPSILATGQELLGRSLRPVRPTPHAELYAGRQKDKDATENSKKQLRQRKFVQQEA